MSCNTVFCTHTHSGISWINKYNINIELNSVAIIFYFDWLNVVHSSSPIFNLFDLFHQPQRQFSRKHLFSFRLLSSPFDDFPFALIYLLYLSHHSLLVPCGRISPPWVVSSPPVGSTLSSVSKTRNSNVVIRTLI